MATYYVDYAGSAGTGDGSSFANRASKMEDIWSTTTTLGATDEVRIKGNPVTSLGTARIGDTSRSWWRTRYLNDTSLNNGFLEYSTTTGETKLKFGSGAYYGWETGDRIFIIEDTGASTHNQPSLVGIHELTVVDDYTTSLVCKLDGYTASSNASSTTGVIKWMVLNTAIKLNTTGLFKNIACMDLDRSAWTVNGSQGSASIYSYPTVDTSLNCARWPSGSDELTIDAAATVGKVAHYQLPSTLDLSGYQQVSFLVKVSSEYGRRSETPDTLRLCTDTNGDTSVHTIPIDLKGSRGGQYYSFTPVTVNLGVNLNTSIKSIALYREQTQAAETFWIQNVVACKNSSDADAITHSSCIGLKEANNPIWHHVDILWEDWLIPASGANFRAAPWTRYSHGNGYWSSNGSAVTVYKVEPIRIDTRNFTSTTGFFDEVKLIGSYSGTTANLTVSDLNTVSGGWNNTDMSSKSADYATIIQGDEYGRTCLNLYNNTKYLNIQDINFHRWDHSIYGSPSSGYNKLTSIGNWGCTLDGYLTNCLGIDLSYYWGFNGNLNTPYINQHQNSLQSDFNVHCLGLYYSATQFRFYLASADGKQDWEFGTIRIVSPGDRGSYYLTLGNSYSGLTKISNVISVGGVIDDFVAISGSGKVEINTFTSTNGMGVYAYATDLTINQINMTRPIHPDNPNNNPSRWGLSKVPEAIQTRSNYSFNHSIGGGNIIGCIDHSGLGNLNLDGVTRTGKTNGDYIREVFTKIGWRDFNGTTNDHRTFFKNVDVFASTNSNILRTPSSGVALQVDGDQQAVPLGKIAVNANSQVTVSIWIRADNTFNSHRPTLRVKAQPYMGINSDQEVKYIVNSATSGTWVQLSKSFTPTAAGFLDVEVQNDGSTTQYYDDFEVTQV